MNAKVGDTLLDVAKDNDVDLEGKRESDLKLLETVLYSEFLSV